ncbi:MAG: hypothetical protein ABL934_03285 [Lysobacteraceae bacterium]
MPTMAACDARYDVMYNDGTGRAPYVRSIEYGPARGRMALWIDGYPRITRAHRQYLRWAIPDADPPPHDDPEWITPP